MPVHALPIPKLLVSVDEAAELLSCSARHVQSLAGAGQLPCVRLGHRLMFSPVDLAEWLAAGRAARLAAVAPITTTPAIEDDAVDDPPALAVGTAPRRKRGVA